ncbi:DUF4349 domain-containing protein [Chloroflexota bacterium]
MRKLKVIVGLLLVVALLVPVSCARAPGESEVSSIERPPAPVPRPTPTPTPTPAPMPPAPKIIVDESLIQTAEVGDFTERMIVRTGDMSLVVNDVPVAIDQITGMADGFGGYVVSSRVWKEGERLVGSIAIRVPAEHFDDATRALREMAVDVTSERTSSKDITEEYIDLSAKLKNLEATEEQYLRLMEKAEKVEDILNIQRELSKTRGEIEQTKGRMQYLERTSATSLIEVHLEKSTLDVEFTADKRRVKEGERIQFTVRQIAGGFAPYSYEWDFGDGNTNTDKTPTHTYKTADSYTVSLKVTDDQGNTNTETRDGYIFVSPGWSAGITASGAWDGMVTFGHVLANIFIWIGIFSPVWIVIGGIVYWWRWRRRRKKAQ